MLSLIVPEPLDAPKESSRRLKNARRQPGRPGQGEGPGQQRTGKHQKERTPKSPTTSKQRTFTVACEKEYEKDAVQPYCRHTAWGPSTPADVHQLGPRSCRTARSVATLTNEALTDKRQSERQLSGGNKVELCRPLESTSKPQPPRMTLKRRPAYPARREQGPGLDPGGGRGPVPSPSQLRGRERCYPRRRGRPERARRKQQLHTAEICCSGGLPCVCRYSATTPPMA